MNWLVLFQECFQGFILKICSRFYFVLPLDMIVVVIECCFVSGKVEYANETVESEVAVLRLSELPWIPGCESYNHIIGH